MSNQAPGGNFGRRYGGLSPELQPFASGSLSGFAQARDLSSAPHLSRHLFPTQQRMSPGNAFDHTDGGSASRMVPTERSLQGPHSLLPGSPFPYSLDSFAPAMSPLNHLPFPDAFDGSRFGIRPPVSRSDSSVGGVVGASGRRMEPCDIGRRVWGQGHALFGTGQSMGSLQGPAYYPEKECSLYFDQKPPLDPTENFPKPSVSENSMYDRNRSPHFIPHRASAEPSHSDHSLESFVRSCTPSKSPFTTTPHQISSPQPYQQAEYPESYSQKNGHDSEDRSQTPSAGVYQSYFPSPLSSQVPVSSGSAYLYRNSSNRSANSPYVQPFPSTVFNAPGPSFDQLARGGHQLHGPPPTHSLSDAPSQSAVSNDDDEKPFIAGNVFGNSSNQPLLARTSGWRSDNHFGSMNLQGEQEPIMIPENDNTTESHMDRMSQMQTPVKIEHSPDRLVENSRSPFRDDEFQQVGIIEVKKSPSHDFQPYFVDSKSSKTARSQDSQTEAPFSFSNKASVNDASFQKVPSSKSKKKKKKSSQLKACSVVLSPLPILKISKSKMTGRKGIHTPPSKKTPSAPFVVTPDIYSDSSTDEDYQYQEPGGKIVTEKNVGTEQEERSELVLEKEKTENYDSSTSEYEPEESGPPSPFKVSIIKQGRRGPIYVVKKKDGEVAFIREKTGKEGIFKKQPKLNERKQKRTSTPKPSGNVAKRTCPVCNKVFSRADSLTCHMRVHTGDRPYICEYCCASYKVASHLREHVRSKHTNTQPYECGKCQKTFAYLTAKRRHEKVCGMDLSERVAFQCNNCEKGFVTAKGYQKHQLHCKAPNDESSFLAELDQPFQCIVCERRFSTPLGLDRHQRFFCGRTPQKGEYTCEECGKVFTKRARYITHTLRHTGEKPIKCSQCDACFYDQLGLKRHEVRHGEKNFFCTLCDKSFYMKRCLSIHIQRVHNGMKPFKCPECELEFFTNGKLSRHVRRVHRQEKRFQCLVCPKAFFESAHWKRHMDLHANPRKLLSGAKRAMCRICKKFFLSEDISSHVATVHPNHTVKEALRRTRTKVRSQCDICFKTLSCRYSLKLHKMRHTGLKTFVCTECDKSFTFKSALIFHQRRHTDYRPHPCPDCGKMFRWKSAVTSHRKHHHEPKPEMLEPAEKIPCPKCGKMFKRELTLKVHMKKHSAVMPYICSYCGKGFVDNTRLKIHMSAHDIPKPFKCQQCDAGFFYQYLLNEHMKKKHSAAPRQAWLCEGCGKALYNKISLKSHMEYHAKYPDRGMPKPGRIKGSKYPRKQQNIIRLSQFPGKPQTVGEDPEEWMKGSYPEGITQSQTESSSQFPTNAETSTNVDPLNQAKYNQGLDLNQAKYNQGLDLNQAKYNQGVDERVPSVPVSDSTASQSHSQGYFNSQAYLNLFREQFSQSKFSTFIHNTIPWPQTEDQ